jgi:multicomponent Na+:H+ antiporter subunit E
MADIVSLLPGTLSVELTADSLTLHVLDVRRPPDAELDRLEARVAELFGLELEETMMRRERRDA